jgi:hypothetical protein
MNMNDNHSDCCGGLDFPNLPHLHAENCPTRKVDSFTPFRESPDERRMFDSMTKRIFDEKPLAQISASLDTWGRAQMGPHGYGSYSQQCFIMANEVMVALARIEALEAELADANKLLASMPEDLVDHQRDLLEQTGEIKVRP